jgi:hypothetical protein
VLSVANKGTCLRTGLAPADVVGEYGPGEAWENMLSVELELLSVLKDDAPETLFCRRRGITRSSPQ